MNSNPQQELSDFRKAHPIAERGVYFLSSYANHFLRVMERYKDVDPTSVFYIKADVEDLINDEIQDAIDAYSKDLKSKKERHSTAEYKLGSLISKFLDLYERKKSSNESESK